MPKLFGGKGFFVSGDLNLRGAHLRKISVWVLVVCLLNIGWNWPFHKNRDSGVGTQDSKNSSKQWKNRPLLEDAPQAPGQEILTSDGKGYRHTASPREQKSQEPVLEITRSDDTSAYVTRSISIINRDEIKKFPGLYVPDLLRSKAGVVVSETFSSPKGMTVDIRGFGESGFQNVLVLVDGRRTNQVDLSGTDWAAIPLSTVERIEIMRGPSTVLYGDNATGGVINIVTQKTREGIHAKAQSEIGMNKYRRNGGTVEAGNDWARGLFHYENTQDGGWRTNSDYWANDWFGKLSVGPFYGAGVALSAGNHHDRYGMPGYLLMTDIEQVGRRGSLQSQNRGWTGETYFTADPEWKGELGKNGLEVSAFNTYRQRQSKGSSVYFGTDWESVSHIDSYELKPKVKWTRSLTDWLSSKMTTGIDFAWVRDDIRSGYRAPGQDFTEILKKTLGVYILESLSFWDKLLLNLGFRSDWTAYRFDQKEVLKNLDTAGMWNPAFDIGLGYHFLERSLAYFDLSRSFRTPVTEEFFQNAYIDYTSGLVAGGLNVGLKQQQQMNYELGVRDNTFHPLEVAANVFLTDIEDEIYFDKITNKNSNYSSMTRRYGLELESSVKIFEKRWYNIKPFFNLTLQKPYFKGGDYADKLIPFVPSHKASTGFVVEPVAGLTFSTELNYLGSRFPVSDVRNSLPKMKPYTRVDLKARYQWKWASAWIALTNLFDRNYFDYGAANSSFTAVGYYPARGRNLTSGFSLEY